MLDADLTAQLSTYLTKVTQPVELIATLDDRPASTELAALLTQIAGLSELVTYRADGTATRAPSFLISRVGTEHAVEFAGIPLGHEFTSLVLALLQMGGHPPKVSDDVAATIRDLPGDHHFTTYMSLSCQNCPDVVQALNAAAALNPRIRHTAVEGSLFQDEVSARSILAVPTVYLGDDVFGQGRMSIDDIIAKLDDGADDKAAARLNEMDPFEVLVVGAGPAGATAAIYAARKGIRTGIVTERFGGQVLDTMSIENLPSVPHTEGPKLASDLRQHVDQYGVEVITSQRATAVHAAGEDGLASVDLACGATLRAKSLILAPGAAWRLLGVPGETEYRNKGVTFCPHCDGPLFAGKPIAVVGGGNSGIEAAIDLAGVVGHVTVIEFLDELKADEVLVRKLRSLPNVDVITSARTTEIVGNGSHVTALAYEDRSTGELKSVDVEGVFVQIGLVPTTAWLKDTVALTDRGEIIIDERGATNIPGIYAAGDATTEPYKQIVVAMGAGSTAALGAFDHLIRASSPQLTSA